MEHAQRIFDRSSYPPRYRRVLILILMEHAQRERHIRNQV